MATHAGRLVQDQNFIVHFDGSLVGGGKNNGSKAQKKGGDGLAGRKTKSNSGKPCALQPSRKQNVISGEDLGVPKKANAFKTSVKAQVGGRKALSDITNSGKPSGQNVLKKKKDQDKKLLAIAEEEMFLETADEGFLHNHQECIKSQRAMDCDYFKMIIGFDDVVSLAPWSSCEAQDDSPVEKLFEVEELPDPYMQLRDFDSPNFDFDFDSPNFDFDFNPPNFALMESP